MTTSTPKRVRLRDAMVWVACLAVVFAALKADAFVTLLILAYPVRYVLIAWGAGLRIGTRRGRLPISLPQLSFVGGEADRRSFAIALGRSLAVDTLLVGLWPAWREVALDLAALATDSRARSTFPAILRDLEDIAHDLRYWRRLWTWEAWSLARWWLLFGSLTIATTPLSRRERPGVEGAILLLRFSPWLIALEIGFMIGVWIARWNANIVPEPSTIFASGWGIRKYGFLFHVLPWLKRGGPSTFVVGIAFFRTVPGWRWVEAVLGSLVLVLIAIPLSIAWSMLWMP